MKNQFVILASTIFLLFCISCEHPPGTIITYFIKIQNNSNNIIYAIGSKNYPDTVLPLEKTISTYCGSGEIINMYIGRQKNQDFFSSLPNDTLRVFFIHPDTLKKYDWEYIRNNNLYMLRKDVDFNYLNNNNNTITYP
jgi:hypothetical protein